MFKRTYKRNTDNTVSVYAAAATVVAVALQYSSVDWLQVFCVF